MKEAPDFLQSLAHYESLGKIPSALGEGLRGFYHSFMKAAEQGGYTEHYCHIVMNIFLQELIENLLNPFQFPIYHKAIRAPFDYYQFGMDMIKPLIDEKNSKLLGEENVKKIVEQLACGENVVFLANHQTEPDPQAIHALLEKKYPSIPDSMIYVAGHRVTTDPLAVPMSKGCNLLCIWSKKHIDHSIGDKAEKLDQNRRTMLAMLSLLNEGGKAVYVAPSGGRDRPDAQGNLIPSPYDPQSVEMFLLKARHSKKPVHFYPMALRTYAMMPPPDQVLKELGEPRYVNFSPISMGIGDEINIEELYAQTPSAEKMQQREWRARYIWQKMFDLYTKLESH